MITRRDWVTLMRFCACIAGVGGGGGALAFTAEIRHAEALHMSTRWLTAGAGACFAVMLCGLALAIVAAEGSR